MQQTEPLAAWAVWQIGEIIRATHEGIEREKVLSQVSWNKNRADREILIVAERYSAALRVGVIEGVHNRKRAEKRKITAFTNQNASVFRSCIA